jgi:hypothetical protein
VLIRHTGPQRCGGRAFSAHSPPRADCSNCVRAIVIRTRSMRVLCEVHPPTSSHGCVWGRGVGALQGKKGRFMLSSCTNRAHSPKIVRFCVSKCPKMVGSVASDTHCVSIQWTWLRRRRAHRRPPLVHFLTMQTRIVVVCGGRPPPLTKHQNDFADFGGTHNFGGLPLLWRPLLILIHFL